jgi:hypothetical protein
LRVLGSLMTTTNAAAAWGATRATPVRRRDWAGLPDGPAGLIAERMLAGDVWRRPAPALRPGPPLPPPAVARHAPGGRREGSTTAPPRHRFLNVATGRCVVMGLPELHQGCRAFGPPRTDRRAHARRPRPEPLHAPARRAALVEHAPAPSQEA